jgi:hypothetical protein
VKQEGRSLDHWEGVQSGYIVSATVGAMRKLIVQQWV